MPAPNITVTDNQGVTVSCPQDTLDIGEVITCAGNGSAVKGQYKNIGTVTAAVPRHELLSATDPSHYYGNTFPWVLFPIITPCATDPLYCFMIADGDNQGNLDSRLFKYNLP